jgi:large subunit ribosomal protein L25
MQVQVDAMEMGRLLSEHGTGGIIALSLTGEKHPKSVLVREIQRDPLTDNVLHVDFQQVSMSEEVRVSVPLVLVGESPAVKAKAGILLQVVYNLEIRGQARQIPEKIEVDISDLIEAEQAVHLRDISLGEGLAASADLDGVVVKVEAPRVAVEEEVVPVEEATSVEATETELGTQEQEGE